LGEILILAIVRVFILLRIELLERLVITHEVKTDPKREEVRKESKDIHAKEKSK
jgi:hypothetical protein